MLIKLVYQDVGGDENGVINVFQNLINKNWVLGIVGLMFLQQVFVVDFIVEWVKVLVLGISNIVKGVLQIGIYVVCVLVLIVVIVFVVVKQVFKFNFKIKKVVVMYV